MAEGREAKFLKDQEERLAKLEKKKNDRKDAKLSTETTDAFYKNFNTIKSQIDLLLSNAGTNTDLKQRKENLNNVLSKTEELQLILNSAISYLPNYDVKKNQDILNSVHLMITEKQLELIPKKKFAFGKKKNAVAAPKEAIAAPKKHVIQYTSDITINDKFDERIELTRDAIFKKDILLRNLSNCQIFLQNCIGTLHCTNCKNCTFNIGPISGSLFLEECDDSVFTVTCQQGRIHTTKNALFYIHVTSKAIIEDSQGLRFGKRKDVYEGYQGDMVEAGLGEVNNWNDVDDFNWLSKEQSPNWSIVEE